jgi:hypothetical protein
LSGTATSSDAPSENWIYLIPCAILRPGKKAIASRQRAAYGGTRTIADMFVSMLDLEWSHIIRSDKPKTYQEGERFPGRIGRTYEDSEAAFPMPRSAPKGGSNILYEFSFNLRARHGGLHDMTVRTTIGELQAQSHFQTGRKESESLLWGYASSLHTWRR